MGFWRWLLGNEITELKRQNILIKAMMEKFEDKLSSLSQKLYRDFTPRGRPSVSARGENQVTNIEDGMDSQGLPPWESLPKEFLNSLPPEELEKLKNAYGLQ